MEGGCISLVDGGRCSEPGGPGAHFHRPPLRGGVAPLRGGLGPAVGGLGPAEDLWLCVPGSTSGGTGERGNDRGSEPPGGNSRWGSTPALTGIIEASELDEPIIPPDLQDAAEGDTILAGLAGW